MQRIDASALNLKEKLVKVRRVTKVVKGGRNMRISILVVVGDEEGHVGYGIGKAAEFPDALKKGIEQAKKNLIKVPMVEATIPHEAIGEYGAGKVLLKPATAGTGVIAGGPVRAVLELAGIHNIRTKSLGSNNAINMVCATIDGLSQLRTVEEVAKIRGKAVEEIMG